MLSEARDRCFHYFTQDGIYNVLPVASKLSLLTRHSPPDVQVSNWYLLLSSTVPKHFIHPTSTSYTIQLSTKSRRRHTGVTKTQAYITTGRYFLQARDLDVIFGRLVNGPRSDELVTSSCR